MNNRNYQGLFDEIDSCTASIEALDDAINRCVDSGIRAHLLRIRIEYLRTRVRLIQELHLALSAEPLEMAA